MNDSFGVILLAVTLIALVWVSFVTGAALLFMWAWNLLMPLMWAAAPHITLIQAIAAGFLLGVIRGIIQVTVTRPQS